MNGEGLDTTVAVFNEERGLSLACNDDVNDCSFDSMALVDLTQGQSYLIRIAGHDGTTGPYTLTVTPLAQAPPEAPANPGPTDQAQDVSTTVVLSWDNADAAFLATTLPATAAESSHRAVMGVYGRDDRLDEYQVEDARIKAAGDATVVLVDDFTLKPITRGYFFDNTETLDEYVGGLCPDEPFADQPTAGLCSGFLVAPDLIVTAGHCQGCSDELATMGVVFGYVMEDADTVVTTFKSEDVYFCKEIVAGQSGSPDWSLIRLDRPVTNHIPVRIRRSGFVAEQQPLLVVGHPTGLPRKYDSGAVTDNWRQAFFSANLDTFGGNSGSAVFNLETMAVEGILVVCNGDFVEDMDDGCMRCSTCPDSGCPLWEDITHITVLSDLVPSYAVYLGTDPDALVAVDTGGGAPCYVATDLEPGRTYYWQIIAHNAAGETPGPIWSFTTAP